MSNLCDQCKSIGLPILLARYAVVPSTVKQSLPSWTSGDRVKSVALGSDYKYALRTLRAGYVYLFYGKGPRGSDYWECYTVGADGSMILQPSTAMAQPQTTPELVCKRDGHTNQNVYFLVIQEPQKCGPVWIAFSEHKWSEETLTRYKADKALRDKRMQTIQPPAMAGGAKHTHGQIADAAVVKEIVEFASRDQTQIDLPYSGNAAAVSTASGAHNADVLARQSTRYPWYFGDRIVDQLINRMIARGRTPDPKDKDAQPHVLALWDAVGITHELNGFRNEAAGCIAKYGNERELEITAMNAIEGVKQALQNKAASKAREAAEIGVWKWTSDDTAERLKNVQSDTPERMARHRDLCRRWEQDALNKAPDYIARQRQFGFGFSGVMPEADWVALNARVDAQLVEYFNHRDPSTGKTPLQVREERSRTWQNQAIAEAWPKYEKKLQAGAQTAFKQKYEAFLDAADKIIDARTVELIKWLEAPLFIDALEDYHDQNVGDGVAFEDMVGDAIFGIASTKSGAQLVEKWVAEAKASVKTNLVWRAIALNQKDGVAEVDAALAHAVAGSNSLTIDAWGNVGASVKWNKIADLYKKALSLSNANVKQGVNPVNTRGVDKVLLTVGDLFLKPFARVVDTVGEKVVQTLLLVRAGSSHTAALALVETQARYEGVSRARLIQRLNTANAFVTDAVSTERAALNTAWTRLRSTASTPSATGSFNAAMEVRLGLVVAVLEGVNLWKLSQSVNPDAKVKWQIRAAMMATTAASLDIAASAIKGLATATDAAVSFQVLKVSGGVLSAGASFIGGYLDWEVTLDNWGKRRYGTAVVYGLRSLGQFLGGVLTLLTALSYAAPLLSQLSTRFASRLAVQVVSRAAIWALGARAGLMLAGIWVSAGVLVISLAIWYFSDDALEDWCEESAFGKTPQDSRFVNAEVQMKALDKALIEVL
jgi:hypothetical protein